MNVRTCFRCLVLMHADVHARTHARACLCQPFLCMPAFTCISSLLAVISFPSLYPFHMPTQRRTHTCIHAHTFSHLFRPFLPVYFLFSRDQNARMLAPAHTFSLICSVPHCLFLLSQHLMIMLFLSPPIQTPRTFSRTCCPFVPIRAYLFYAHARTNKQDVARLNTLFTQDTEIIIDVVRSQKQEKLVNILRILSMLSYFLDQVCVCARVLWMLSYVDMCLFMRVRVCVFLYERIQSRTFFLHNLCLCPHLCISFCVCMCMCMSASASASVCLKERSRVGSD